MGFRLSKIYTKTGDKGETGLADGTRIKKSAMRMDVIGTIDELNSWVGAVISVLPAERDEKLGKAKNYLSGLQHTLFDLGGELAIPGSTLIDEDDVTLVEQHIDLINDTLEPLKNFVLPGGSNCASQVHLSRTCCRRAERLMFALIEKDPVNPVSVQFINRLSDFLFVLSRYVIVAEGKEEVIWQQKGSIKRPGSR